MRGCRLALAFSLILVWILSSVAAAGDYWVKFPRPKTVYVTEDISKLPALVAGKDVGGHYGSLGYMLQSLSGLAALSASEGKNDAMLWLNHASNESYNMWLDTVLKVTRARRIDQKDCLALVREFARRGVVKGYIVYRAERSDREMYSKGSESVLGHSDSVNIATSMSPVLGGALVAMS
ncbi:MAG TPA: hypothetical protein VHS28_08555 [Chloroflexota bacterium]|nr:hypothetical protein [Chloroflexota bacterium]